VSNGHLHSESTSTTMAFFSKCSEAAFEIDKILETYESFYCLKTAPYIISYATYVSATIHVRIAAQQTSGSQAHRALRRCLNVLDIHQSVAWAPRRAKRVIDGLLARLGIVLHEEDSVGSICDAPITDADIDAIMQTFAREQQLTEQLVPPATHNTRFDGEISAITNCSTTQPSSVAMIGNESYVGGTIPSVGDSIPIFTYDPIFGINGMSYDDWDLGVSSDMI
jgi:hypothetical protein